MRILIFCFIVFSLFNVNNLIFSEESSKEKPELPIPVVLDALNTDIKQYGFDVFCYNTEDKHPKLILYTNRGRNKSVEMHQFFMIFAGIISQDWYYWTGSRLVDVRDESGKVYRIDSLGNFHCRIHSNAKNIDVSPVFN